MKRVLQVVNSMGRGGIETFIMNVYRAVDRKEVQFDFLLLADGGDYEAEIESLGGRIYRIPGRNKSVKGYYKGLKAFFSQHAHEYVAVHQHVSALIAIEPLCYARKYGIAVRVVHAHNSSYAGHWAHGILHRMVRPFVTHHATHFIGCSDKAIDWMYKTSGAHGRAEMIRNGVDVNAFAYDEAVRVAKRAELNIDDDTLVWGHIGRFVTAKNHFFLIDIFNAFHMQHPRSRLLLLGDGELMSSVRERVDALHLGDSVTFMGVRGDIPQLMQAMDLFVMPSLYEGLPVSLVEAQSAGLLTVVSDTITTDVKITSNIHFLPLSHTPEQWSEAIAERSATYERRDVSHDVVCAGYDIKTTAERLVQIYNSVE